MFTSSLYAQQRERYWLPYMARRALHTVLLASTSHPTIFSTFTKLCVFRRRLPELSMAESRFIRTTGAAHVNARAPIPAQCPNHEKMSPCFAS